MASNARAGKTVDLDRRVVRIEHSYNRLNKEAEPKTKGSRRAILILDELAGILKVHLERTGGKPDELVFRNKAGNHINCQNMMTREFYPALERAGLPRIRFHDLRHTYAAVLITIGGNVQKQLGHASLTTIMDTYGHLLPEASIEFGSRLDSFLFTGNALTFPAIVEETGAADGQERVDNVWTA